MKLEFYIGGAEKHIAALEASGAPRAGEYINIRGTTYLIAAVTWAVDHADRFNFASFRANVVLEAPPEPTEK